MSAERLREAARVLREWAEAANAVAPGPWVVERTLAWDAIDDANGGYVAEFAHKSDPTAAYIAKMHPGVGLAIADLLTAVAHHVGTFDCEAHCEPDGCSTVRECDRIADLILGDAS